MRSLRKQINVTEDIMPLSQFKVQASKILNSLRETGRSVVITQNWKPSAVVITPEEFDLLRERQEFITAVEEGLADSKSGRTLEVKEIEKTFDQKFGKLK